jgi:crotonobetainyl-CoA:carnitine CoA-transferase CaiB-like acyl-CoA transferase
VKDALAGLRVLDFCWVGAGALVTKLLAEHGAEVIKVESRARPDNLRVSPPYREGGAWLESSGYFASRNNDKKSLALNMRTARGRELARTLAEQVDVVANNFRPGVMERWGLGYDAVAAANPSVVYLSMPMQGSDGPNSGYIGFGSTIAALAGLVHLSGHADRTPVGTGTHYPDHVPSPGHALVALLAAIRRRARTGEGAHVELSQLESAVAVVGPALVAAGNGGPEPTRRGNRVDGQLLSGVFRCRGEDAWCAIAARDDAEWAALARVLGLDSAPPADEAAAEAAVASKTAARDSRELAAALQAARVPASPVLTSRDLLEDPQLAARGFWRTLDHPVIGALSAPSAPFRRDGERTGPERAAPLLGEHTRELASSLLGLADDEIARLEAEEVLW